MGHVLKANQVRVEEPLRLNIDGTGTPSHADSHGPALQPHVRVAESNGQFAVLEVTCACGRVTHVRCDYGAGNNTSAVAGPAQP